MKSTKYLVVVEMAGFNRADIEEQLAAMGKRGYTVAMCEAVGFSPSEPGMKYWKVGIKLLARHEAHMIDRVDLIDGSPEIEWWCKVS